MNYFQPANAAERYAKGRPAFHANTIAHVRAYLQLKGKLNKALDIACGTGLSTRALLDIAQEVYGTDLSPEMLRWAQLPEQIQYAVAPAEQQPFPDAMFDLITVCSGVHWFDIDRFLAEANRLLAPKAWLALYDNFFISQMDEVPAFSAWYPDVYLKRFPAPARKGDYDWSEANLLPKGFVLRTEERFHNPVQMSKNELILYFTTQSNITAAIESGATDYDSVEQWLDAELSPFFDRSEQLRTIQFGNWIKYIQKIGTGITNSAG